MNLKYTVGVIAQEQDCCLQISHFPALQFLLSQRPAQIAGRLPAQPPPPPLSVSSLFCVSDQDSGDTAEIILNCSVHLHSVSQPFKSSLNMYVWTKGGRC